MKIKMLASPRLVENLGNLSALNLGKFVGLLKQDREDGIGTRFVAGSPGRGPGNTSQVVDAGVMKDGIKSIRRAYRDYINSRSEESGAEWSWAIPVGFALYINGKTVAFGLFHGDDLAGGSRSGKFAYDLTDFQDAIDSNYQKKIDAEPNEWRRDSKMQTHTSGEKERKERNWDTKVTTTTIRKFVGGTQTTRELAVILSEIEAVAAEIGTKVTIKVVTSDSPGARRGKERRALQPDEVRDAGRELRDRLVRFKNNKRPSADNIQQFISMVTDQAASVINFDGVPWRSKPKAGWGSDKMDPVDLLKGRSFSISYNSAEPNSYASLNISYRYNVNDNTIRPWTASWSADREQKTIILDNEYWVKSTLGIPDLEKPTVVRKMLTMIKERPGDDTFNKIEKSIGAMRQLGEDWPEFNIILKSIESERNKEKS